MRSKNRLQWVNHWLLTLRQMIICPTSWLRQLVVQNTASLLVGLFMIFMMTFQSNMGPNQARPANWSGTRKKVALVFWTSSMSPPKKHKHHITPDNLRKWPKCYRTAPSPMTDVGHYTDKNNATKMCSNQNGRQDPAPNTNECRGRAQRFDSLRASPPDRSCFCSITSSSSWILMMIWWMQ